MPTSINNQSRRAPSRSRRASAAAGGIALVVLFMNGLAASPVHAEGTILAAGHPDAIPGSYIVALKDTRASQDGITTQAADLATRYGGKVNFVYHAAITGFSINMDETGARRLAADPSVDHVEQDLRVELHGTQSDPPAWGVDRIDEHALVLDSLYAYPNIASNVSIYILDTGVRFTHDEFGGRAFTGFDAITPGGTATDCNGHGTHVAATAAGTQYGVAKQARIYSVRVLNCGGDGSTSSIVAGINWVADHADQQNRPAVANMSLGTNSVSTQINNAVNNSITAGVTYVVSAGNDGVDACGYSPASAPTAITVGATNNIDARAAFGPWGSAPYSNYGPCLDLFAPGYLIRSASHGSDTATRDMSGTSMATPHVTGAAAMILSDHPTWSPAQVASRLVAVANTGQVSNPGAGSPNRLLHTGVPPVLTGFHCESGDSEFLCDVGYRSVEPGTIAWYRNGIAVPAWDNDPSVFSTCDSSTTVRAVVANPHGSVSSATWRGCRSGPWQ